MPRNGNSGSGGSKGGAPRRSMSTAPARPPLAAKGLPVRVPPPSAPVKPPTRTPAQGAGAQAGPSAAGTFGASAAGAAVGTMVGSALSRAGEPGAGPATGPTGYTGECANAFTALLECANYNGGDLDRCLQQKDSLIGCLNQFRNIN